MCVESISFVGKYVPIDTGTEIRGCRNTQKVLHNIKIISPRLINILTKQFFGTLDILINLILKVYLGILFFLMEQSQSGRHFLGCRSILCSGLTRREGVMYLLSLQKQWRCLQMVTMILWIRSTLISLHRCGPMVTVSSAIFQIVLIRFLLAAV